MHRVLHYQLAVVALFCASCFVETEYQLPDEFGTCEIEQSSSSAPVPQPTYFENIKPILDARCVDCHQEGGIGPFSLTDYETAFRLRGAIGAAVASGSMPPWQPDDCCSEYRWDLSLPEEEKALLLRWVEIGAPEGLAEAEGAPIEAERGGLSRVDLTLTMPEPFEPKALIGADEVRCFVLEWPLDRDAFVTGMNIVPGDRSMVHHVVLYAFPGEEAEALRAREGADGRPGWDCYGELASDSKAIGSLGGWTPGARGVEFPDGLGRKVPADAVLVLNMHYDTGTNLGIDQSSVELMISDAVEHEIDAVGIVNPLWLVGDGMRIEKDDPDATTFFHYDPTAVLTKGKAFRIYSVNHHMHELGSIGRIAILRSDGTTDCLLNITEWDFDWLGEYWFKEPIVFNPGDELYIECHWDNRSINQKIVNGEQLPSRDLAWGTDAEMCAGVLNVVVED